MRKLLVALFVALLMAGCVDPRSKADDEDGRHTGHYDNGQIKFLGQYEDGWPDAVVNKDNCRGHPMRFQILDR